MDIAATSSSGLSPLLTALTGDPSKAAAEARAEARRLRQQADAADNVAAEATREARTLRAEATRSDATARTSALAGDISSSVNKTVATINAAGKPTATTAPTASTASANSETAASSVTYTSNGTTLSPTTATGTSISVVA